MILLIDNYDSFTYNLFQQIAALDYEVTIAKHDQISIDQIKKLAPSHIIISPGPKTPQDSGISMDVVRAFYETIPILGVCLGHQCIGEVFGATIVTSKKIMHGKPDSINHSSEGLFKHVPNPFLAARYHSLMINQVPEGFKLTAWSDDKTIMAIQHNTYPVYGVQFHPESFMTEYGKQIMKNFLT